MTEYDEEIGLSKHDLLNMFRLALLFLAAALLSRLPVYYYAVPMNISNVSVVLP